MKKYILFVLKTLIKFSNQAFFFCWDLLRPFYILSKEYVKKKKKNLTNGWPEWESVMFCLKRKDLFRVNILGYFY